MKILGIVVEYNPFHTGHLYHLEKAKEILEQHLVRGQVLDKYLLHVDENM